MGKVIKTWQVVDDTLHPLQSSLATSNRTEMYDLEAWIASTPAIVSTDIAIIGRQVSTKSGPLDLLAIDQHGNTVIIELKRDTLPRMALAQAIDYASDVAEWSVEKLSEVCTKYTNQGLDEFLSERFPDTDWEVANINESQRIFLVGFGIQEPLERMINWLSSSYGVNINAILLQYIHTKNGDELLSRVTVISEEIEQQRSQRKKIQVQKSDEPGQYPENELKERLTNYFGRRSITSERLRKVVLPILLQQRRVTRDQLAEALMQAGEATSINEAGTILSTISLELSRLKNDFLRQVIGYEYHPDQPWRKEYFYIRDGYTDLIRDILIRNEMLTG